MTTTASRGRYAASPRKRPAPARLAEGWGLSRAALVLLEIAVAAAAYVGSFSLIGDGYGMPAAWLDHTPFDSWTGPGILLLLVVALPMTAAAGLEMAGSHRAFACSVAAGVLLTGWIVGQVAVIGYQTFLQLLLLAAGLVVVLLAYLAHPAVDD